MGSHRPSCSRSCSKRMEIRSRLSAFNAGTEAIRRTLRANEPNRSTITFRLDARSRLGDAEMWRTELAAPDNLPSSELIDLDENVAIPLIDGIVNLLIEDEEVENTDINKIRQVSSSFSVLAEAFDRVAANGGTISDDDREVIRQAAKVILQLAFYSDLVTPN